MGWSIGLVLFRWMIVSVLLFCGSDIVLRGSYWCCFLCMGGIVFESI